MPEEAATQASPAGRRPRDFRLTDQVDLVPTGFTETARQRQVLDAVVQGLENKQIAGALGVSEQRAKELVSRLLMKFEVRSRAALARVAVNLRLLGLDTRASIPYSYLFDESPVLMAITEGPDHRYVLVNSAFVHAFGDRRYVGRTVRECFPDAPEEAHAARERTYVFGERYAESEATRVYRMPSGERREFVISFITEPVRSASNAITGVIFYCWDVTEVIAKRRSHQSQATGLMLPVDPSALDPGRS